MTATNLVAPGSLGPQVAAIAEAEVKAANSAVDNASTLSPRPVAKALVEAIREELRALVEGDLDANFSQIEKIVIRSRELFMTLKGPDASFTRGAPVSSANGPYYGAAYNVMSSGSVSFPGSITSNPEQFGAQAIRQLVSMVPEILNAKSNSPDKLMKAISLAKKDGHHDIAEALKKKLLGESHEDHSHKTNATTNGVVNGIVSEADVTDVIDAQDGGGLS